MTTTRAAESLAMILTLWNHETRIAFNGTEALAQVDQDRPQVVLLDIGLPGMDGYSVARSIRSRPEFANTILVAMTGYGTR